MLDKTKTLFIYIENSSRSQMAEGFAEARGMSASSAGTFPASYVNPLAVDVMKEIGIDISGARPKPITEQMVQEAEVVVLTDSSLEESLPRNIRKKIGKKLVVWSIADPQGQPIEVVRFIRDQIERSFDSLMEA
jgi:arsenate reductase (thioredoxin)